MQRRYKRKSKGKGRKMVRARGPDSFSRVMAAATVRMRGRTWFLSLTYSNGVDTPLINGPGCGYSFTTCNAVPIDLLIMGKTAMDFGSLFQQWYPNSLRIYAAHHDNPGGWQEQGTTAANTSGDAPMPIFSMVLKDPAEWYQIPNAAIEDIISAGGSLTNVFRINHLIKGDKWLYTQTVGSLDPDTPNVTAADEARLSCAGMFEASWPINAGSNLGTSAAPLSYIFVDWDITFRGAREYEVLSLPSYARKMGFQLASAVKVSAAKQITQPTEPTIPKPAPHKGFTDERHFHHTYDSACPCLGDVSVETTPSDKPAVTATVVSSPAGVPGGVSEQKQSLVSYAALPLIASSNCDSEPITEEDYVIPVSTRKEMEELLRLQRMYRAAERFKDLPPK
jgi:hypothetical protein